MYPDIFPISCINNLINSQLGTHRTLKIWDKGSLGLEEERCQLETEDDIWEWGLQKDGTQLEKSLMRQNLGYREASQDHGRKTGAGLRGTEGL